MGEGNEGRSIEQHSLTTREKVSAVLNTLRKNRNVQIDGVLMGLAAGIPAALGHLEVGGILAPLSTLVRPAIAQHLNQQSRNEAILADAGSYGSHDEKHILENMVGAWKTGTAQLPGSEKGFVDSVDTYSLYHPSKS